MLQLEKARAGVRGLDLFGTPLIRISEGGRGRRQLEKGHAKPYRAARVDRS